MIRLSKKQIMCFEKLLTCSFIVLQCEIFDSRFQCLLENFPDLSRPGKWWKSVKIVEIGVECEHCVVGGRVESGVGRTAEF